MTYFFRLPFSWCNHQMCFLIFVYVLLSVRTGPSLADAAVGRIAQGTRVLAEGGYEKVFQNTFENAPEEKLLKSYGCYLSTSAGPVVGVLYLSTAKVAFCSDDPLSYKVGEEVRWSYYKVWLFFAICLYLLSFLNMQYLLMSWICYRAKAIVKVNIYQAPFLCLKPHETKLPQYLTAFTLIFTNSISVHYVIQLTLNFLWSKYSLFFFGATPNADKLTNSFIWYVILCLQHIESCKVKKHNRYHCDITRVAKIKSISMLFFTVFVLGEILTKFSPQVKSYNPQHIDK